MKKLFTVLLIALLLPSMASAWDRSYVPDNYGRVNFNRTTSIEVLGWRTNLDGNLRIANTGSADDFTLDLDTEGDFDDETRFGFRVTHVFSEKSAIEFSYMKQDNSGRINKTDDFTFEGKTYDFTAGADMTIKKQWFDIAYMHNLARANHVEEPGREAYYLDAMIGVKFNEADLDITGTEKKAAKTTISESWSESFPVPYIGLGGAGQLSENLWVRGQIKYINVNASGNEAKHSDYGINFAYRLNQNSENTELYVDLGYRGIKYDVDTGDDRAELSYRGPTFGIFARF